MKLSRESEYGLAGLVHLARQRSGAILPLRKIAGAQALPRMFLAKIFRKLTRHGILRSYRGRHRGYALAGPAQAIGVKEILEGIEGMDLFARCIFWSNACSDDHPCLLHETWKRVRPEVIGRMARLTLADLAADRAAGPATAACSPAEKEPLRPPRQAARRMR